MHLHYTFNSTIFSVVLDFMTIRFLPVLMHFCSKTFAMHLHYMYNSPDHRREEGGGNHFLPSLIFNPH